MEELVDLAAERAVLAGVFTYGEDTYLDVSYLLRASTFTDDSNHIIWKCLKHLYEEKEIKEFDQASVLASASELNYSHMLDRPDEIKHLASIFHTKVLQSNVVTWAAKLRKLEIARLIREQLKDADRNLSDIKGTEPIEVILGMAEDAVLDFSTILDDDESKGTDQISEGMGEWLQDVEDNPREAVGVSSGWPMYDQAIGGGFRRGTVSLMGARPKIGKSMVSLNISMNVSNTNIPVLYLDTEMKREDHWPRMLASVSRGNGGSSTITDIELGKFRDNNLNKAKLIEAKKHIEGIPFHYRSVIGLSIEETLPLIRRWLHKEVGFDDNGKVKDCLVIYDYIKLQTASNISDSLKEYQALGFTMGALHNFVGRFDIPMFTLMQLNRGGETDETGAAFSQSDRILWLVTNYSIFKPKTEDEAAEGGVSDGNRKIVPVSARHGEGLREGNYINMFFEKRYANIREGTTRDNIMRAKQDAKHEGEHVKDDKPDPKGK